MQQIQYVECTTYLDTAYLHSYIFQMYVQYNVEWKYVFMWESFLDYILRFFCL